MAFKKVINTGTEISGPVTQAPIDDLDTLVADLQVAVNSAYDSGVTMEEAERMAAKCLSAQLDIARALSASDLDSRMRKNGLKASKANAYLMEVNKHEKKPSDTLLENIVASDLSVQAAQNSFETSDARKESLNLYFGIFKDAHIYFRGISKGNYQ